MSDTQYLDSPGALDFNTGTGSSMSNFFLIFDGTIYVQISLNSALSVESNEWLIVENAGPIAPYSEHIKI
jgi:hypothetical protein